MNKSITTALTAMSLFATGTALAAEPKPCSPEKTSGAYIAVGNELNPLAEFIDQLELRADGSATWWQSTSGEGFITGSGQSRQVGSWKCVSGTTLVVTTIGMRYHSTQVPDPDDPANILRDVERDSYSRGWHKFVVVNRDTLQRVNRVFKAFDLSDNPLDPNATPISVEAAELQRPYRRVVPLSSDLP